MLENIKAVNNPLTIIAIFAALAEIAGTVALATVDKSLQGTFVWFVMGFPVLLVGAFFATLNFNPRVLYAPSDFRDEENFLSTLVGTRNVSMDLNSIMGQLEQAKKQILGQAVEEIATVGGRERKKLVETVSGQLNAIELRLDSVRREAQVVASTASVGTAHSHSGLQARILHALTVETAPPTVAQIAIRTGMSLLATTRSVQRLEERGLIVSEDVGGAVTYRLARIGDGPASAAV
jgi:predicted MarR family transcription regulator